MGVEIKFKGILTDGVWYAVKAGATIAELQEFADSQKTPDCKYAKLGQVTAYDKNKVEIASAEVILLSAYPSDSAAVKSVLIAAQAKVRAKLAGKVTGKRGGRELI